MSTKLDFDATKLFEAMKYQIHVAINYCHTLKKQDVLWIEVFGDVTVEDRDQVEVKNYGDSLTDCHENFWNTLNNWLKPDFRHQQYENLILLTTQAYGERAALKGWDELDVDARLNALIAIKDDAENRFSKIPQHQTTSQNKIDNISAGCKSSEPPKVLKLQRKVLDPDIRASLIDALSKIKIITEQPNLEQLISSYKMQYLKGIHPHRMDDFINDLFGFMTSEAKISGGWRFTCEEFDKKFAELTARYLIGKLKFPRVNTEELECNAEKIDVNTRRFAMKLNEIGGNRELILQATTDLLHAQNYILELVKDLTTSQQDIDDYSRNQLTTHNYSRSSTMHKCDPTWSHDKLKTESISFYFGRCSETVDPFSSYDFTPIEFRNGIYHMLAEVEPSNPLKEFHWRLWK